MNPLGKFKICLFYKISVKMFSTYSLFYVQLSVKRIGQWNKCSTSIYFEGAIIFFIENVKIPFDPLERYY